MANQRKRYIITTGAWPGLRVLSRIVIGCWETLCNKKFAFYTDKIKDKNTAGLKFIATLAWLNDFQPIYGKVISKNLHTVEIFERNTAI